MFIYDEMDVLGLCADLTERISFCLLTVYPFLKIFAQNIDPRGL